jgi:predicted nucleic acid-binding protein
MVQLYNDPPPGGEESLNIAIDTSAVLAVLLDEPSRSRLVALTGGAELLSAGSLPWEVGNALSALVRRGRIDGEGAARALRSFGEIPVRFPEIDLAPAVELAEELRLYAYDAYVLECARRYRAPLLSLDLARCRAARAAGIDVMEI